MAIRSERRSEVTPPPSLWEATAELVAAGQQVVLDRVDLLRNELTHDVTQLAVGSGLVVGAAVVVGLGWVGIAAALVLLLHRWLALDASFAIVGGLHVALGVALAVMAVRRFRAAGRDEGYVEPTSLREVGRG